MKLECPKCGSNVAQILMGADDSRYTKCLGCGEVTSIERRRIVLEEPRRSKASSQPLCEGESSNAP